MKFDLNICFPTLIGHYFDIIDTNQNKIIYEKILNLNDQISEKKHWNCDVITSFKEINIQKIPDFFELNKRIEVCVNHFARNFNSLYDYKISESWFNIYYENNYQETHVHPESIFSCVYYVSCPEGSSNITFESFEDKMIPLKNIEKFNNFSSSNVMYSPPEKSLLVFKSNLKHNVNLNKSKDPRITISCNFA